MDDFAQVSNMKLCVGNAVLRGVQVGVAYRFIVNIKSIYETGHPCISSSTSFDLIRFGLIVHFLILSICIRYLGGWHYLLRWW